MRDRINILDILVDKITLSSALKRIRTFITTNNSNLIVTPNAEMIMKTQQDKKLQEIINQSALAVPDGSGVVLAAKILGNPMLERVAGIDLVHQLLALGAKEDYDFYFLGAAPGIAQQAKNNIKANYSNLSINTHHGYLTRVLEEKVINDIINKDPDILLVGMGVPLQEKWLAKHLNNLSIGVGIGVGGTFDVLSGTKNRAPKIMQRAHLEWLYRLLQEPERLGRMIVLPKFVIKVLRQKYQN